MNVWTILYENQRRNPLVGKFSDKYLLPTDTTAWSSDDGKYSLPKDQVVCPPNWIWTSDWIIDMNGSLDSEGWAYAPTFKSSNWHDTNQRLDWVRRRKWIRMRANISEDEGGTELTEDIIQDPATLPSSFAKRQSLSRRLSEKQMMQHTSINRQKSSLTIPVSGTSDSLEHDTIFDKLCELECDSDKIEFILQEVSDLLQEKDKEAPTSLQLDSRLMKYINQLEFEYWKVNLIKQLKTKFQKDLSVCLDFYNDRMIC